MPAVKRPLLLRLGLWRHRWLSLSTPAGRPEHTHERIASALMNDRIRRLRGRAYAGLLANSVGIAAGAVLLRAIAGVGFVNYDTLYALVWGGQLSRGSTPAYGVAISPTPHPLMELVGLVLSPLGPRGVANTTVALAFVALSACGWVIYRLGAQWFGRAAGALAALIFLTRVPVLSYGVRAYVDVPYVLAVLAALLVESNRRRAGAPVLLLLALAGLLRPEAWAFSGLYALYLLDWMPPLLRTRIGSTSAYGKSGGPAPATRREMVRLLALAASAPLVWVASDLLITGQPLWSLTHTQNTASTLDRVTGIANVPEYIPRRIGEILRPPVLVGAAIGGVLSLLWMRRRAALGASAGVVAVLVFAAFAAIGLPINSRYAFLASAILCLFCGAGVFGWTRLEYGDRRRPIWMAAGALVALALLAYTPAQYRTAHKELVKLARQQSLEGELVALVDNHTINLSCGPVGVPNHAPVPLLALYLKTSPANIVSLQVGHIPDGVYVDPASKEVEEDYVLDQHDPHPLAVNIPPGFTAAGSDASWLIFKRCV